MMFIKLGFCMLRPTRSDSCIYCWKLAYMFTYVWILSRLHSPRSPFRTNKIAHLIWIHAIHSKLTKKWVCRTGAVKAANGAWHRVRKKSLRDRGREGLTLIDRLQPRGWQKWQKCSGSRELFVVPRECGWDGPGGSVTNPLESRPLNSCSEGNGHLLPERQEKSIILIKRWL